MKTGTQVRLKENPTFDMTIRAIIEDKAVCDYISTEGLQEWVGATADLEVIEEQELFPLKLAVSLAGTEIKKWLDFKRVKPAKRNAYASHIGLLVQAVAYGEIEIRPDFKIVHNLNVPLLTTDNAIAYSKLEYAPRINAQALNEALGQAGDSSEIANTIAYGSALADLPVAIIRKLDTSDLSVITALSVFFS